MVTKEEAKEKIKKLIEKYNKYMQEDRIKDFNESNIQHVFVEPLFKVLGWNFEDIDEVKTEENVPSGVADYAFKINAVTRFFVETKAPQPKVIDKPKSVRQAVDYAHYGDVSWAILTDFEDFRFYDAEAKVKYPENSRIPKLCMKYNEYLDKFDSLWILSKESFKERKLEKLLEDWGRKPKRPPITVEISEHLNGWREGLTKSLWKQIIRQYPKTSEEEIDEWVQRVIDRLIFIRVCEDREIDLRVLRRHYQDWQTGKEKDLYKEVQKAFDHYTIYDSEIFERHPFENTPIEENLLSKILSKLYEYNFRAISADVLGSVYEQYLSYILTKKKVPKLEKSKRKKMGIYYTPTYIVDYIVKNTLGEIFKDTKTEDIKNIRILDPACGSGSFLIKAYDLIELEFKKRFNRDLKEKEKVQILLNNLHGVDLDPKAIEIARLNLMLKAVTAHQKLPELGNNIKCGNSLIDDKKIAEDKAFKWKEEFKEIMEEGGFNIIIGNPPYGAELNNDERKFLLENYPATKNNTDTAIAFINKSFNLLKKNDYLGLIVPKPLIYSQKWTACREFIKNDLVSIVDVSKAFKDVLLEQVIIIIKKSSNKKNYLIDFIDQSHKPIKVEKNIIEKFGNLINDVSERELLIANKINKGKYVSDVADIKRGLIVQKFLKDKGDFPVLRGKSIGRYLVKDIKEFITKKDYKKIENKSKYLLKPKIIVQNIVAHVTKPKDHIILMSTMDEKGLLALDNVGCIFLKDNKIHKLFLISLLNSRLMSWYAYRFVYAKAIRTMRFDKYHLAKLPLCRYKGRAEYDKINILSNKMLSLSKHLNEFGDKRTSERSKIKKEIEETDKKIDQLVYELYELTPEEIKIVEESVKS